MRVGLMTREYPPNVYGGAGVHVEYLSLELAKKIEVEVHCWGTQNEDSGNLHVRGDEPPPQITGDTKAKFKAAIDAFALNLSQMKSLAEIDIVHTHTWYVSMAGFLAKKLYGIPFVLTTHSLEPLRAWKAEQLGSGYALSSWMERTAILDADAIIAVSNGTKADIITAYPNVDPARIHVIYNGIDLNQYQKTPNTEALTKYGVDITKPYVLFVGRITRQKGVTHLVDAIRYLPPGTQVVLCAGAPDTPEIAAEMRAKVEALRRETPGSHPTGKENHTPPGVEPEGHSIATGDPTGTGHNVVWIEQMVTKEEAIQLYSHCAVFACPSVYEPFGIINLEAMACKAPVVATATGGILEVVVEGETGHLVPFKPDPKTTFPIDEDQFARDLAAPIAALLADPARAKKLGEAGRKRVEDHFAWSAIADQTIALYETLIAKK
ncbi:glycogen synthase [Granulicella tundricola]|uniref:Glycogen synthase n=1 Tax=Granulicella tundricola (strain ATCC BAA-1859 / DSM 23138 / MP5ACTX9) TaxID=1198114 RepID=E8X2X1_GRATM|nr:glycogen synthase [Granulicella tundricola]ADW68105.1 glycogen synthase [Granulicella tundricola MP5ACTX9]